MDRMRIVVGVDGSEAARDAVRWSVWCGRTFSAEIIAVHGVGLLEDVHDPDDDAGSWRTGLRDLVERTWCSELAQSGCEHRVVVRDGPPVDVLMAVAREERADLLIVGSRGIGATIPALALGSTSLRVLRAALVPVLVVPSTPDVEPAADGLGLCRILVGVDRSEPSFAALGLAADVASATNASISVLEVFEYEPPFPLGPATSVTSRGEELAIETMHSLLEADVCSIRDRGVAVQVIVRSGEPAPTLLAVAEEMAADLVVVGTHGRGDPAEPLLGSVARTVVNQVRCPTLVVPGAAGRAHLTRPEDHSDPASSGTG
jgi:nucleotide-binding universal stress UspA family protein